MVTSSGATNGPRRTTCETAPAWRERVDDQRRSPASLSAVRPQGERSPRAASASEPGHHAGGRGHGRGADARDDPAPLPASSIGRHVEHLSRDPEEPRGGDRPVGARLRTTRGAVSHVGEEPAVRLAGGGRLPRGTSRPPTCPSGYSPSAAAPEATAGGDLIHASAIADTEIQSASSANLSLPN